MIFDPNFGDWGIRAHPAHSLHGALNDSVAWGSDCASTGIQFYGQAGTRDFT